MPNGGIWGTPASSLNESGALNAEKVAIGSKGEEKVAAILNRFAAKYTDVSVYHSVKKPGVNFDVDHVVITRGAVIFIDAKAWKARMEYTAVSGESYNQKYPVVLRRPLYGPGKETFEEFGGGALKIRLEGQSVLRAVKKKGHPRIGALTVITSYGVKVDEEGRARGILTLDDLAERLELFRKNTSSTSSRETRAINNTFRQWKGYKREPYPDEDVELDFGADRSKAPVDKGAPADVKPELSGDNDSTGIIIIAIAVIVMLASGVWFWTNTENFWAWLVWSLATTTLPFLMGLGSAGFSKFMFHALTAGIWFFHIRHLLTVIIGG